VLVDRTKKKLEELSGHGSGQNKILIILVHDTTKKLKCVQTPIETSLV